MRLFLIILAVLATATITSYTLRQVIGTQNLTPEEANERGLTVEELIEQANRALATPSPTLPPTPTVTATPPPDPTPEASQPDPEPTTPDTVQPAPESTPRADEEDTVQVPPTEVTSTPTATRQPSPTAAATPRATPTATPRPTATEAPRATPQRPAPTPADDAVAWWAADVREGQLAFVHVGMAAFDRAIAVLLDGGFDSVNSANVHLEVLRDGTVINGSWQISSANQNLLYFPLTDPGTYQITLGAGLEDRRGRQWPVTRRGEVTVP